MAATIIFTIIGIVVGFIAGYFLSQSKSATLTAQLSLLEKSNTGLQQEADAMRSQLSALTEERTGLISARDVLTSQLAATRQQLEQQKNDYEDRLNKLSEQQKNDYEDRLNEIREQQKMQMEQQSKLLREQINTASEEILKKRSDELSATNKEQIATILSPLQENLKQMREAVEKSDREHSTSMARLDQSIKENLKQAKEVGERADKLAQALTSENKTQGNFGELRLRTLLENMGLEEGTQFEEQVTLRDEKGNTIYEESGHRMIPDVILHFPDDRDVIIDSKMSLKAFEDYYNATTPEEKADALNRHIASVRAHVKELAHKNYSSYMRKGSNKLDFVVMYIYSESALQLALANDPSLWKEAYDAGVIISGSQNLYMMLRVLEMTWRQVRQVENQDKIMATADELVNRVQIFYERFQAADDQLGKTQKAFDALRTITAPSGKSIATAANNLVKFGAKENPKRKAKLPKADNDNSLSIEEQ